MSRSAAPARNQQTGCSDVGSKSAQVTIRSTRPTNVSPAGDRGSVPDHRSGICLYFVTPTESDAAPTTLNLLNINHIAEQPDWN